ncbi:hypothetical protein AYI68_g975 [Smittium mucronatum]|uniref:Uncharacterized protein n=1 Tax=Smittium mucronatum TaxID=133383 RepID=A0A1R0H6N2_9FUNG|nr:hypothetical protein AYI68_g975 [Smittium mucronatum]
MQDTLSVRRSNIITCPASFPATINSLFADLRQTVEIPYCAEPIRTSSHQHRPKLVETAQRYKLFLNNCLDKVSLPHLTLLRFINNGKSQSNNN